MDFARNERGFCVGFAWNLILFSFVREREGYEHHADCTVYGCGGHLGHATRISRSNFSSPYPWMLNIKFHFDWPSGFREEDL